MSKNRSQMMSRSFLLSLLTIVISWGASSSNGQAPLSDYINPMLRHDTPHHDTVLYAQEQIKLYFRILGHGKISFKKYQLDSMHLRYRVHDFDNNLVLQGREPATWTYNKKLRFSPAIMLHIDLPAEQSTGWFRVSVTLAGQTMTGEQHVFGNTWADLAIVPQSVELDNPDRFFGLSAPLGAIQPTPPLTQYNQPVLDRMGVRSLRVFTHWDTMQDQPDAPLDYRRLDRLTKVCQDSDIQVMMTLMGTPDFAALPIDQTVPVPVRKPIPKWPYWESFVKAMATHYRGQITAWEILNETNGFRQWPNADPQTYADFYMQTYKLIREIDPKVRISIAGTTGVKYEWIDEVAKHGAAPMMDIVAIHPYRYPQAIPEISGMTQAKGYGLDSLVDDLRGVTRVTKDMPSTLSGHPREIWSTESGYNTLPSFPPPLHKAITEKQQAQLLVRTMILARAEKVDRFFWWRFYDTLGAGLGILRNQDYDYMPKPAVVSYAVLQRQIAGAQDVKIIEGHKLDGVFVCKATFTNKSEVNVIWTINQPTTLAIPSSKPITVVDIMGVTRTIHPIDDKVSLPISQSPVYMHSPLPVELLKP